jgi:hypothetical protein
VSKQFPARDGDSAGEVAQRTPDGQPGDVFRRVFTIHLRSHTMGLPSDHWSHFSRFTETVADATRRGLHPKGQAWFESEALHPNDPKSVDLTYAVRVVPASVDTDAAGTTTPAGYGLVGEHGPEIVVP